MMEDNNVHSIAMFITHYTMTDAHHDSVDPLNNSSNSLPLLPFHIHIVECTKFIANETDEGRKPIIQ